MFVWTFCLGAHIISGLKPLSSKYNPTLSKRILSIKLKKSSKTRRTKKKSSLGRKIKILVLYALLFFAGSTAAIVGLLRFIPLPTSAFMLHRHVEDFQQDKDFTRIQYQWVSHHNISPNAFAAVVAAEDQRFFQHHGFDIDSILTAVDTYLGGGKLRGASTISQQVAKNLFLNPARSFWRKGFEVWFTLLIEIFWSKQRILEVYLNIAEFGNHLFGVEAASHQYFGITAKQLSAGQAALLAATLPNPRQFKANRPTAYLRKRQSWIMRQMKNLGYSR